MVLVAEADWKARSPLPPTPPSPPLPPPPTPPSNRKSCDTSSRRGFPSPQCRRRHSKRTYIFCQTTTILLSLNLLIHQHTAVSQNRVCRVFSGEELNYMFLALILYHLGIGRFEKCTAYTSLNIPIIGRPS